MSRRTSHVFLSHNSGEKPFVRDLAARLDADGIRIWFDEKVLVPGTPWQGGTSGPQAAPAHRMCPDLHMPLREYCRGQAVSSGDTSVSTNGNRVAPAARTGRVRRRHPEAPPMILVATSRGGGAERDR